MIGKTWYIVPLKLRTFCNHFESFFVRDTVAIVDLRDNLVSIVAGGSLYCDARRGLFCLHRFAIVSRTFDARLPLPSEENEVKE